jgi:hypothetical protein
MRLTIFTTLLIILIQFSFAGFDPCKFNFGTSWEGSAKDYSEVDYITIWVGSDDDFNINWTGSMLQKCKSSNKTPVLYSSIIALTARRDLGLKDCNVGTPNLCQQGAQYIKDKKSRILGQYDKYIIGVKNSFGVIEPIIWLMEPDFYQYCEANQEGGALSQQAAGQLMHELVVKIKTSLPNAVISMDISPWNPNQSSWFSNFQMDDFMYINTSGGQTDATSGAIRAGSGTSWKSIHDLANKCIIADDGYATGGSSTGHDPTWDDISNLKNRISDGVIAITQANPKSDWASTITTLRPQLEKPVCPCQNLIKPRFSLTITTTGSGIVSVSPAGTSFDSGSTVTVTANPETGETFNGWSGALSGSNATETIIMGSNKSVSAAFSANKPINYALTIKTSGSGAVSVSPQGTTFPSGTSLTLTATPGTGASFIGWSGGLSGSASPATLVISGNAEVLASFYGGPVAGNLVKNGDFTTNGDSWGLGVYDAAKATGGQSSGKYKVTAQTVGAAEWNIQLSQTGIKLEQGKNYVLSFKASAQSVTTLQVNIGMSADPYTSYSQLQTVSLATHDSVYSIPFTMSASSTNDARLEFNGGKTSGTWSIDDIVLIDPSTVGVRESGRFSIHQPAIPLTLIGPNDAVTVTIYDHAGRVVRQATGRYGEVAPMVLKQKTGMYLMTVKASAKRFVKKIIFFE